MSSSRPILRSAFYLLCVVVTIAGLLNVFGDNAGVQSAAESVACGTPGCSLRVTRIERTPIGQSFTFQLQLVQQGADASKASVDVHCKRSLYLVGEYSCTKE
jgi:hypothetical protein